MTKGRYAESVDHGDLLETVADCAERGDVLPGGGVALDTLAEHMDFDRSTLSKHCRRLADRGDLERRWGVGPNGPQRTYLPADGGEQQ